MGLWEFFYRYFVEPIELNQGYNVVNTIVYALILGLAVLLIHKMLRRMEIRVDEHFFVALMPYIILGPLMRAMTDVGLLPRTYLTVSPGAYFVIAGFAIVSLFAVWRHCRDEMLPLYRDFGLILLGGILFLLAINWDRVSIRWEYFRYFIPSLLVAESFVWLLSRVSDFFRRNALIFYTHFYDATTTFVGIQFFGFWEQHVLARALIEATGTALVIYLEKLLLIGLVLLLLERLEEDEDLKNLVRLTVFILGFGPGTRNLLITLMG